MKAVVVLFLCCIVYIFAETTVRVEKMQLFESKVHEGNILPNYLFMQGTVEGGGTQVLIGGGRGTLRPFSPDDSVPSLIWKNGNPDVRSPQLPYLSQDQWGCERESTEVDVVILENEFLKATFTPAFSGKLYALYDKVNQREMFANPKTKQPVNIGALKAWSYGGVEFANWSPGIIGHAAFSESQVYMGTIDTPKGPIVRIYEYDRYNSTAFQVDFMLDGNEFWAHPKVFNPTPEEQKAYWWTCAAYHNIAKGRVIAPAKELTTTSVSPLRNAMWPFFTEHLMTDFTPAALDHSYPDNHQWGDSFLRIDDDERHYINFVEKDGYNIVHEAKDMYVKLFTFGNTASGRFMMDLMNGFPKDRSLDYIELQTGIAPTQMNYFVLPANGTWEWSEVFKPWMANEQEKTELFDTDYNVALGSTQKWFDSEKGIPESKTLEMNEFFRPYAEKKVDKLLFKGSKWGAVDQQLTKLPLINHLEFINEEKEEEGQLWNELARDGKFSAETLARIPSTYQVSEDWRKVLETSQYKNNNNWLTTYLLGVIYTEQGFVEMSKNVFNLSIQLNKNNPLAYRSLALLCSDTSCAEGHFSRAWSLALEVPVADPNRDRLIKNLGTEIVTFYLGIIDKSELYKQHLTNFLEDVEATKGLPNSLLRTDQYLTAKIAVYIHQAKYDEALNLLSSECFPTYGRSRRELITLWNRAQLLKKEAEIDRKLNVVEQRDLRMSKHQPRNIGCPYAEIYCLHY